MRIYNIDTNDYEFADLIIETDEISPQQIAGIIINKAQEIV
jgi:cytidylate kinase